MLLLSEKLRNVPVMSLQTGTKLANTDEPIIDAANLTIVACYVLSPNLDSNPSVLFMNDIREAGELGFIIDDSANLMPLDGLVRLQEIIDENFHLIGISVVDKSGKKIGKVTDYSFTPDTFVIQQLFVQPGVLQSLIDGSRVIHRKQIIDVTPKQIVVDTLEIKSGLRERAESASSFVNPFRSPDTEPQ